MAPIGLGVAERPHPCVARTRRLTRSHCSDQSHAITTVVPLSCPYSFTSHQALRSAPDPGPIRQHDRVPPPPAWGADASTPRDSPGGGQVPFFSSFMTVVGLTCNTRAVSRMPLAFMAI